MSKFEKKKKEVIKKTEELITLYEQLTKKVAPRYWRRTGDNFKDLRRMLEDLEVLTEATPEDLQKAHELGLLD